MADGKLFHQQRFMGFFFSSFIPLKLPKCISHLALSGILMEQEVTCVRGCSNVVISDGANLPPALYQQNPFLSTHTEVTAILQLTA